MSSGPALTAPDARAAGTDRAGYRVSLPLFEGPLDLLLHLIEREELDITSISLVQVTDQYLLHIGQMESASGDALADFLVIAARLILIKSQALLPRPPARPGEEPLEDAGEELARQLREYKRFKQVARGLGERDALELRSFVRVAPTPRLQSKIDLEGVGLEDLLEAVRRALAIAPPAAPVGEIVRPFVVTIQERAALILDLADAGKPFAFDSLLSNGASRLEIIVTFLALLELLKRKRVRVAQTGLFGEIAIEGVPAGVDEAEELDFDLDEDGEWSDEE
jgi:segregation and condensation protein A